MRSMTRGLGVAGAVCALALALAACGGSSSSSGGSSGASSGSSSSLKPAQTGAGQTLTNGTKGGTLTVLQHEDYQHLDPGQAYFALDYDIIYATQTPLYMFPPNDPTHAVPLLATGQPQISDGGKTVTVHIRSGVKYSPPVNRAATSQDVAYAIERAANPNVANPYFPAYFDYIQGASKATGGPIAGIQTPNSTTIVFHLTGPYGGFFAGALSMPITSPVPKEFVQPLDQKKPTQYGSTYLVDTGPYMVQADSKGKIDGIGYQTGKSATLVRNPNWTANGDPRPAYVDKVNINIGGDPNVIGRQTLTAKHTVMGDAPSAAVIKLAYQKYYSQLFAVPGTGDFYVAMNNRSGPFSNVNVRKAFWAALDREAMVKVAGGQIVGAVGTHFIYPGSAGFTQSGGDHGPNVDYNNYPTGNMTVAEKYMKLAGFPSGKYTGSATIKVVGSTGDPADKDAAIANQAARNLGFKTNFTLVQQAAMYQKYCGDPKAEIDLCPNVGWIRDWSDPQTLLDPTFAGYNNVTTNNSNWGQVSWQDGPLGPHPGQATTPLDKAMRTAEKAAGDAGRATAWAKVDEMLVANAVAAPWYFTKQPVLVSADVRPVLDLWNQGSVDYNYTSLK